jgi:hypothetical protein
VAKRLDVIRKSILKLGGHNRKIAVVMNATVIKPDDLVEQLLDPKKFPAWQGERIKMVKKWATPTRRCGWATTPAPQHVRPDTLGDQQRAHRGDGVLPRNRPKMDAGCEVSWEHCFDPDRASPRSSTRTTPDRRRPGGLRQRVPERAAAAAEPRASETASAEQIAAKVNGLPRGVIPAAGVPPGGVHRRAEERAVLDGRRRRPTTSRRRRRLRHVPRAEGAEVLRGVDAKTLAKVTAARASRSVIYAGLDALVGNLMAREWERDDGAVLKPERILIDANWGESRRRLLSSAGRARTRRCCCPATASSSGRRRGRSTTASAKAGDRVGPTGACPAPEGPRVRPARDLRRQRLEDVHALAPQGGAWAAGRVLVAVGAMGPTSTGCLPTT